MPGVASVVFIDGGDCTASDATGHEDDDLCIETAAQKGDGDDEDADENEDERTTALLLASISSTAAPLMGLLCSKRGAGAGSMYLEGSFSSNSVRLLLPVRAAAVARAVVRSEREGGCKARLPSPPEALSSTGDSFDEGLGPNFPLSAIPASTSRGGGDDDDDDDDGCGSCINTAAAFAASGTAIASPVGDDESSGAFRAGCLAWATKKRPLLAPQRTKSSGNGPTTRLMRKSWSWESAPLNKGSPVCISTSIQPRLQISMAFV